MLPFIYKTNNLNKSINKSIFENMPTIIKRIKLLYMLTKILLIVANLHFKRVKSLLIPLGSNKFIGFFLTLYINLSFILASNTPVYSITDIFMGLFNNLRTKNNKKCS